MRVHHLNCGTWCPPAVRFINGTDGVFSKGTIDCHCLLLEGSDGLVLVDTGMGVQDLEHPSQRVGAAWAALMRPVPDPEQSALHQIEELGFYANDVRHIVVTHLDFDHAGGLPDFPEAQVHVYQPEFDAAMQRKTPRERFHYKPYHWEHQPHWVPYQLAGDRWFGFESVRALGDRDDEILLVPLLGHTRGHCGVAVNTSDGWLLLAGDAYFHHSELDPRRGLAPAGLRLYQQVMHMDKATRLQNLRRLQTLAEEHHGDVRIFSSHDPSEFDQFGIPQTPRAATRR